MLTIRSNVAWVGLVVTAAVTTAGIALAADSPAPKTPAFDDTPTPMAQSVSDDQLAFAVLRRARTATDVMPGSVAAQVGNPSVGGKNVALARAISTPAGTAWVIPGNGSICLAVPDPASPASTPLFGVTCNSTDYAVQHGLTILMLDPRTETGITTIVTPDRAGVSIAKATGAASPLALDRDGVASSAVTAGDVVSVRTARGSAVLPVPTEAPGAR
jgi:hypothetical protein